MIGIISNKNGAVAGMRISRGKRSSTGGKNKRAFHNVQLKILK
jgi:hypothetical protein